MAKNFNVTSFHHQDSELPSSISVPEKHFSQWLQKQFHLAKLRVWIGFAEFVLSLLAAVALIALVAIKAPESLKYLLGFLSTAGSVAGITVGVRKYLNRNKPSDEP